jgi:hypothetical protein
LVLELEEDDDEFAELTLVLDGVEEEALLRSEDGFDSLRNALERVLLVADWSRVTVCLSERDDIISPLDTRLELSPLVPE